eukprot:TRINITY_DN29_c0_g1_i4.p4 TRINITY_DN29_c0_g1~~TRINITY_DN29_c0_g1_i4.p4  ORF type:complete len:127 (-),score=0.24 TRINITY_DN29_c0_g1_i4:288-668(-)
MINNISVCFCVFCLVFIPQQSYGKVVIIQFIQRNRGSKSGIFGGYFYHIVYVRCINTMICVDFCEDILVFGFINNRQSRIICCGENSILEIRNQLYLCSQFIVNNLGWKVYNRRIVKLSKIIFLES